MAWYTTLPKSFCDNVLPKLENLFMRPDEIVFMHDKWVPEFMGLVHKIHFTFGQKVDILTRFMGVLIKIGWAFTW
jgi:hypothetical protein